MHTATLALAAEFWHRHRLGLTGVVGLIAAFAAASAVSPLSGKLASLHSMWFVMGVAYVIGVFAYGFDGKLEAAESGFPARLFVLPVRTSVLVAGPMLQGVLVAALLWFTWDGLVLRPAGIEVPLWWTALLGAIVAISQALVWLPFGIPFLRLLVMIAALLVLIRAPVVLEVAAGPRYAHPETQAPILTSVAIALLPLSYLLALRGVGRARRGDASVWLRARRAGTVSDAATAARRFRTAHRAQLWYEWRARGRSFVTMTALVLAALALLGALFERDAERQTNYGGVFLLMPIILAMSFGPYAGTAGAAARESGGLSTFAATRPFGDAEFVAVKFRAAVLAVLAAWAVVLLMVASWWTYTGHPPELRSAWDRAAERFGLARAAVGCLLVAVVPMLLTWRTYVVGMCSGLTGIKWIVPAQTAVGFLVFLQGMYEWTMWNSDPARSQRILDLLPWLAAGLVLVKIALAAGLMAALRRRDLISLARIVAVWLLAAAGLFTVLAWLMPANEAPRYALVLGILLILPLARPLAAPLAFAWNRHR